MSSRRDPPRFLGDVKDWASRLEDYLTTRDQIGTETDPSPILLPHQMATQLQSAVTTGVLMYCPVQGCVVVSRDGEWKPLAYKDASGAVSGAGAVQASSGDWSVVRDDVGAYTVTFGTPRPIANHIVVLTVTDATRNLTITLRSRSTAGFVVNVQNGGVATDGDWTFIAH